MVINGSKIITLNDFGIYQSELKGTKIVLTGGCFDLLHYGHFSFLKKAKEAGDYLIVALESDEFIQQQKKRNPVHSQLQRAEILAGLDIVNLVIMLPLLSSYSDYETFVQKIKPSVIAVTKGDPQEDNKEKQARLVGGIVITVTPLLHAYSTQKIINSLT